MTLDIHNWSSSFHQEIHKFVKDEIFPIVNQVDARVQNFEIQFLKEAAKFVRDFKSLAKESDESLAKHKALELEIKHLLRAVVSQDIMSIVQKISVVDTSNIQTKLEPYNDMQQKIKRLQAQLGDIKGKCKDTPCVSDTRDLLSQKLENENLRAQLFDNVSGQKDTTKGMSANTKFANQSTSRTKLYTMTPFPKSKIIPKVVEMNDLSKPVTSNSVPTPIESKVMTNDNVIAPGMFRIDPRVDNTAKTRRPQPRSNTKNDRVPSASKSNCIKNKDVEVEEHHMNLLLSKNKKHMSSECNNVKLAIRNDKSEVVCVVCKQCIITANHDVCVLNYVNGMNSRGKKQKANVSNIANQMKLKPKVKKPKNVGSKERLASPTPRKPRTFLRWSPTGRIFVHATCLCARYQAKPTEKHLKEDSGFELTGFSDADYAGCKDTFKSTSGKAQFLGEKLVSWSSKKQDCTALSTAKAEYVSLSACCAQVIWMRTQLTDYDFHFNKILIYCDSKSAIAISCNPTDYQLADLFTKALPVDRFNYLVRRLGMHNLSLTKLELLAKSRQNQWDLPRNTPLDRVEVLVQIFYDHVTPATRRTIDQSVGGKLRDKNAKESWALLEDLALYENESWNDPRDFAKPVKAISLPQDIPSTFDRHPIELKNQVQRLMEAHFAPKSHVQVNKIASSCEICSGPHNTQYCMENPEQAFVEYASSRTDEAGGKWYTFKPEQNNLGDTYNPSWKSHPHLRLSKFKADFKQQQGEMTNKIDTFLKAINDRMTRSLPSDTVKNPKLNVNSTSSVLSAQDEFKDLHLNLPVLEVLAHAQNYNALLDMYVGNLELGKNGSAFIQGIMPKKIKDPGLFTLPCRLGDSKPFDTLADLGSCVNLIPLYLFKKLKIELLEETDHVFRLADGTKSYPVRIVKNVEVHIGRLKLLDDFYVIDIDKHPATPLLVGREFLATANVVIDCRKAKIAVGEGITRSIFGVKEISLGDEEIPYWTTLVKENLMNHDPVRTVLVLDPLCMLRKTLWNSIYPGNGKRLEIPCSTRLRTS
ncbi:MAK10-like protein [Tanacetum coccineum]